MPTSVWGHTIPAYRAGSRLAVLKDYVQDVRGLGGRLGLEAQLLHDLEVAVDLGRLVQVQRAGELLDVDDVAQVRLGEAQDGERAAERRVAARAERQDLQGHRR